MSEKFAVYIVLVEDTENNDMILASHADTIERAASDLEYDEALRLTEDLEYEARMRRNGDS